MDNPCRNCEKNIVLSDIKSVEKVLSYCFPEEFILHYLSFNGGGYRPELGGKAMMVLNH